MVSASGRRALLAALSAAALAAAGTLRADVVLASAAYSTGKNAAEFRTDVRIYNPTGLPVQVTPVFYRQANPAAGIAADTITQGSFTVPARGQVAFDNILGAGLFNQPLGSFGPVRFRTNPIIAPLVVSSGTNNYNGCGNGSISGQWIPGLDVGLAAQAGELVQLAASGDPASGYRTNVVFMNPGSDTANVTAALRRGGGSLLSLALLVLGPNGFRQVNAFTTDFSPPVATTDTDLWLEFTSDQPVFAFASVINNASGDPFAVVALPPPAAAPFAAFGYLPAQPTAGQVVQFGSLSANNPTTLGWSWGDGSPPESGPQLVRTHTFTAPGTYRVVLTATSDGGGSTTAQDVVVTP